MALRGIAALGGMVALLAPIAAQASATSDNLRSVDSGLRQALDVRAFAPGESAAIAVDLATGRVIYSQNADAPLEPASNEKLTVTYGALVELGPDYHFATDVLGEGRQVGDVWRGRLVLKGSGDPTLTTASLQRLAKEIYDLGIRHVTGGIVGDASVFDKRVTAPGWKADYYGGESGPLSGLVVNGGFRGNWLVADPPLAAAALFYRLLHTDGITSRGAFTGVATRGAKFLASVHSFRLQRLLEMMDTDSDNFVAEMVLKAIGAKATGVGSTAAGAQVVRRDLEAGGIPLTGARIVDGSGLSRLDRVTARELSALLLAFWRSPELHDVVTSSLAVAGETGTLENRLQGPSTRGIVRGKTGTTLVSSALSGYVGSRYAFVLLQNGHPVDRDVARWVEDRFVETLASFKPERAALSGRSQ